MADLKISQLPALAEADLAATDELAVVDGSASETKKITAKALVERGVALIDAGSIPSAALASLGANTVVTASITDANVTNAKLANSSLSVGGVSIALGATDATPAFDLTDATNYPAASLTGTLSNSQLANSSVSLGGVSINLGATDATPAFNLTDATGYKTTELVGTISNAQLAGSIAVSKLVGSDISLGGVTISLGGTDATPAFNLTDATNYPTSSLTGTITNAQLAGSIANSKLVNSSVSFGGISVALGAADATPAFDLSDATSYPTSSLVGTITNAQLAGSIANSKLTNSSVSLGGVSVSLGGTDATPAFNLTDATGYPASSLVGTITNAQLAGSIAGSKLVSGSVTSTQLGVNSVTASELADDAVDTNAIANLAVTDGKVASGISGTKLTDGTVTAAKLNTLNIDRSLNVASGNLGINNVISAATRSGISYNAQGLITGTVALAASDLPVATASAVGGVSAGTGLTVNGAGGLSITNSITGATISGITFNAQGMITAATALVAGDLPTSTTSAKGAVQITAGGGLTVSGSGGLTTSTSGISAGTYTKVTVNTKGVATAGTVLVASDIPSLDASKITTGSIDAARIGANTIDGSKLSNSSTTIFGSVGQTGFPTSEFTGQFFFDSVTEDLYIFDGNAYQPVTTLTKGSLVLGGTFNAGTSQVASVTTAGAAAGLAVGSNLPTPSSSTDGLYLVVENAGTPSAPAPVVALAPPDYILGVTNTAGSSWEEIDLSQTVAGQVASNITFTPYGQLSSTNVQDALQELETEKLGLTGGTCTGQLLIGNTGSLVFEGSSIDAYETTIGVTNPTASDKTILFPDVSGNVITSGDTNTVTSTMVDGSLVNTNLAANASIAFSKLAALTSAQIIVGNGSNVPTAVAVTGDIGIDNAGLTSITAGAIVNADVSATAAIDGSKITTGTTSAVGVLQLTDNTTSTSATTAATPAAVKIAKDAADAAATTANAAVPKAGGTMTGNLIIDNAKEIRFSEADGDGANYTGLKAQAQSADITLTLPAVAPTTGQVLKAGSTATTLEWATDTTNTAAADLTGTTLASGVTASSLTSVGSLTSLTAGGLVYPTSDGSANQYLKTDGSGNLSFGTVDLTNLNASNLTSGTVSTARLGTGTAGSTNFLRGDGSWQTIDLSSKASLTGAVFTGNISLNAQSDLRFADSDSSHYVALQSPASVASSFTLTLPATDAAVSGYVLASDGAGTLSWVDPGSTSSPTFTGDVSLTNDGNLVGFAALNATYTGNAKTFTVTVASKTGAHRYNGSGSGSGYKIDGKESPFLTLTPGRTYKFDQADSSNSGHPLRFYLEADKTTAYTTGVTTSGTAGSSGAYTQIVVSDTTPQILHYQCSAHGLMGNSVQTNSIYLPQLAGNLDVNGKNIIFGDSSDGTSDDVAKFGVGAAGVPDLSIYSNGSEGIIETQDGGTIKIKDGSNTFATFSGASNQIDFHKHIVFIGQSSNAAWDFNNNRFSGTITEINVTANNSTDETCYPLFADGATGSQGAESDTALTYNPSSGLLTTASLDVTNNVVIGGDLTVNGTTTSLSSTILEVEDKNIELGKVTSPTDSTADQGGLTLKGTSDKTWNWVNATDAWTSSEHIDLASGKTLKIAGTLVLDATNYTGNAATATNIGASTAQLNIPAGTTAQRPGSPANGMFRYNSTTNEFEGYADGAWGSIGGSGVILIDGGNFDNGSSTVGTANVFDGGDFGS